MEERPYIIIDNEDHASWLDARRCGIGGSDAAAILGLSPHKSNVDLFEEKTGQRLPEDISDKPYVRYGTHAEPLIRSLFGLDYPEYEIFHHENRILRSKSYPFLQASMDGELLDPAGRWGILEIKTCNIIRSTQWGDWKDRIPDHYYAQILHYLLVTGYQFAVLRAHLVYVRDDDKRTCVRHYFIRRSEVEGELSLLLRKEREFWDYVERGERTPLIIPGI